MNPFCFIMTKSWKTKLAEMILMSTNPKVNSAHCSIFKTGMSGGWKGVCEHWEEIQTGERLRASAAHGTHLV